MKKRLSIINLFSVILVIAVNYISQALRLNDTTIGEISGKYDNLFTPAGYAFAIWGVIFLGMFAYAVFQIRRAFFSEKQSPFIAQTGYWFAAANFLNAAWVFAFIYDFTGLSVLIMLGILFSLIKVILNTNMERWDAPIEVIAFVWWPICLYSGWIAVATIANISAYLTKIGWKGFGLGDQQWTVIMLAVATLLNIVMVWKRNMREFAGVAIWALIAIFVRHRGSIDTLSNMAIACAVILFVIVAIHGYRNRSTNPGLKLMERLKS